MNRILKRIHSVQIFWSNCSLSWSAGFSFFGKVASAILLCQAIGMGGLKPPSLQLSAAEGGCQGQRRSRCSSERHSVSRRPLTDTLGCAIHIAWLKWILGEIVAKTRKLNEKVSEIGYEAPNPHGYRAGTALHQLRLQLCLIRAICYRSFAKCNYRVTKESWVVLEWISVIDYQD